MKNMFCALVVVMMGVGCATEGIRGTVILYPPVNPVTERLDVPVNEDGSFLEEMTREESTIRLSGQVIPMTNGGYRIDFDYLHTNGEKTGPASIQRVKTTMELEANQDLSIGQLSIADGEGKTRPIGPEGMSLMFKVP